MATHGTGNELLRAFLRDLTRANPITQSFNDMWDGTPGLHEMVKNNPGAFNLFGLKTREASGGEMRIQKPWKANGEGFVLYISTDNHLG
jgi:hypothetical protein